MRFPVLVLGATVLVVLAGTATGCGGSGSASPRPKSYYLALGDSIAYGFQPTKAPGTRASAFDTGYVDVLAARLRRLSPQIKVVNYGCPGESTVTFSHGGCSGIADGFKLHDAYHGAQLRAAESFLRAHAGEVSPITLTLWGNDWLPLLLDNCQGKAACVRAQGPRTIAAIGARLTAILKRLRAAAPDATIIVTGAWDIDPRSPAQLEPIYRALNASIARAASASGARVAKTLPIFNPPGTARKQQSRLCTLTFICSKSDPHPTDAGYRALAGAFLAASGYEQK
jgi:lysophospholipase L1-like esterase